VQIVFNDKQQPRHSMIVWVFSILMLVVSGLLMSAQAFAQKTIQASLSRYSFTAHYGLETDTFTLATQASIKYQQDQWALRFTQPYVIQEGPAELILLEDGETGEEFLVGSDDRDQRSGYSDPSLRISYSWPKQSKTGRWSLSGRWKIPTADQQHGFSNGRNEFTTSVSRSYRYQRWMFHGRVGRHIREHKDFSDNSARNHLSLGGMYFLTRRTGVGISLYSKEATQSQVDDVKSFNLDLRVRLDRRWQLGAHAGKGLSDSAADTFAGLDLSYRWKLSK
jgi:hypothetical protein